MAAELTRATLEGWLGRYKQAWEQRDAAAAASLFTENAAYHETPFDAPKAGRSGIREYWAGVTADQRNVEFDSEVLGINGATGMARWTARFTSASSGAHIALNGVFVLAFDAAGLCSELREWWHVKVGA